MLQDFAASQWPPAINIPTRWLSKWKNLFMWSLVFGQRLKEPSVKTYVAHFLYRSLLATHKFHQLQLPGTSACFLHPARPLISFNIILWFQMCPHAKSLDICRGHFICFPFEKTTVLCCPMGSNAKKLFFQFYNWLQQNYIVYPTW